MSELIPSRELLDQIVYGMENQDRHFHLDVETGEVLEGPLPEDDEERYAALPQWRSADGYNLMSRFVAELRNPLYRERLRSILASGKGVFRQFKDAVGERPEIERVWLQFKQREMRSIASQWINDIREIQGLERMELTEEEDTQPLIESDFVFRDAEPGIQKTVRELDLEAFRENFNDEPEELQDLLYAHYRTRAHDADDPESIYFVAATPASETAAILWARRLRGGQSTLSLVKLIYVYPDYRGLGLARELLRQHMLRCHAEGYTDVAVELSGDSLGFGDSLEEREFHFDAATMRVDLKAWYRDGAR